MGRKISLVFALIIPYLLYALTMPVGATGSYLKDTRYAYEAFDPFYCEKGTDIKKFVGKYRGTTLPYAGSNMWEGKENVRILEKETKDGLYEGNSQSGLSRMLAYPIKVGQTWKPYSFNKYITFTITSTNKTIKTPAGTFKNVVEVKSSMFNNEYNLYYYSSGVGLISQVIVHKDNTKEKWYELRKILKK